MSDDFSLKQTDKVKLQMIISSSYENQASFCATSVSAT